MARGDAKFIEFSSRYLTNSLRSLVRYLVEHECGLPLSFLLLNRASDLAVSDTWKLS